MIAAGEIGKVLRVAADFDLLGATALTLVVNHSSGAEISASVSGKIGDVVDERLGPLKSGQYVEYTTTGSDFTVSGTWYSRLHYVDATPLDVWGEEAPLPIARAPA